MMDLKTFAIPFGVLMMTLWVWLLWAHPKMLLMAFVVTGVVVIAFYRNAEITEMVVEPRRVLVRMRQIREEVFAKVEEVRKLAEGIGELTAYNIAHLWRFPPADPETARLEERDRIVKMLRDTGVAEQRLHQIVSKVTEMVTWDLASEAWHVAPRATFSTGPAKGMDMQTVRQQLVDRLLASAVGTAVETGRQYLQPLQAWSPEVETAIERFDEFRRTGKLPPRSDKQSLGPKGK